MATVFKRKGQGPWRIAYFDCDPKTGKRRRREYSTQQGDRAVADQIASRLEADAKRHKQEAHDLAELRRRGLLDPVVERLAEHGQKHLSEHLSDFKAMLEGKGNTVGHVAIVMSDCRHLFEGCGFVLPDDLEAVRVSRWVTRERALPVEPKQGERKRPAARTINRKLGSLKAFTRWLWETGRIRNDPMVQVRKLNARTDRRLRRRAPTDDEIARLILAAERGPVVKAMSGPDRAMLYRIAVGTGLRAAELRSLTPRSFALRDLDMAKIVVEAGYSKHRRRDVLPIRRELAEAVARFIEGKPPAEPLFPTMTLRTAEMMRVDMDNAKPWVPYRDAAGRVCDFHSLRVAYITRLARAGVTPAVAKNLARHSTITLTIDHYTDVSETDERAALNTLPALPDTTPTAPRTTKATGTHG